jgi:predicted nucleic acid-binding Zn ribbon protein
MRYPEATCFECGEAFPLNRPDRQFCSGRCRSKNFRRVQSEKLNTLEKLFAQYVPKQDDAPQPQTHPQTHHDLFA